MISISIILRDPKALHSLCEQQFRYPVKIQLVSDAPLSDLTEYIDLVEKDSLHAKRYSLAQTNEGNSLYELTTGNFIFNLRNPFPHPYYLEELIDNNLLRRPQWINTPVLLN
jgi:hypothetical protein